MASCNIEQAVILAGGRGTRLGPATDKIPKPLFPINGSPFLGYLLKQLKSQGFKEVVVLVGYLAGQIREYCGDGSHWGLTVRCIESPVVSETGHRLRDAMPILDSQFLLMYCDNYWPMDRIEMQKAFNTGPEPAMLTVYSNLDQYSRNNVQTDSNGYVMQYDPCRIANSLNGVEIGYAILSKSVLNYLSLDNIPFSHDVYPQLAKRGLLRSYLTNHRYYSIGSPERLTATEAFLKPQKVVILDRDGTLNVRPDRAEYVKSWDQFQWLPNSIPALKLLADYGYKLIIASNQPGIARGMITELELAQIHDLMTKDLAKHNVTLDAIYYCPHGWDDGCLCRKPLPGMLYQAQRDFHLDLTKTLFIGDDPRDKQAGDSAACPTELVSDDRPLIQVVREFLSSQSLKE